MRAVVEQDEALLLQAGDRAKILLENYVKQIADAAGVTYEVRWEAVAESD